MAESITAVPTTRQQTLRVALAGLGAIGCSVVEKLAAGAVQGAVPVAAAVRDTQKARAWLDARGYDLPLVSLDELPSHGDVVVECAPASVLPDIVVPALGARVTVMVLSVGALLGRMDLIDLAQETGGRIVVPSGALLGLDAVVAAAQGTIHSVRMVTRKPPGGMVGAPYLEAHGIDVLRFREATKVFEGTAREAAVGFPANLNVAAALSLAGIGPDRTMIEIWADPTIDRNTHRILVDADSASLDMTIRNIPSENPKTGRITALSVLAALRKMTSPLVVGT
jgi:aspartate dehydrogenase